MHEATSRVEAILAEAVEIGSAAQREQFVAEACGGDAALRAEVERLIVHHFRAGDFLERPAAEIDSGESGPIEAPGQRIGPYKLLEPIGEGGCGVVFLAEQLEPVRRQVALKVIKPGMDSRQVVARFEAERQALALMDHPNIAKVLDAGTTDAGRPYFVMELVHGIPITDYCDVARFTLQQRLELFIQVCRAVQHAHTKGVIHRDLKPSNVLVTSHDGVPVPMIIDFGVAKALSQPLTERTLHTGLSQILGTPLYMSPEQAEFNQLGVDTRSDVYTLGVLLYELLTGTTPFDAEQLKSAGYDEMRRLIREADPACPSQRISTLGAQSRTTISRKRGIDERHLSRLLRRELDWIVMKALEKDRKRRYQSANQLAADVERYLSHLPIVARPASTSYVARKWVRRHPTLVLVTVVTLVAVLMLVAGAWNYGRQLKKALHTAQRLQTEAVVREYRLRMQAYITDISQAAKAWEAGNFDGALTYLRRQKPEAGLPDLRGFEWYFLASSCRPTARTLSGHLAPILAADVSPDDRWIASGDAGGTLKIWEFASGTEVKSLSYDEQELTAVCFAPNGRTLATCGMDRMIHLWNVEDWSESACWPGHEMTVTSLAWSPDSKYLASAGRDHRIIIWDAAEGKELRRLDEQTDVVRRIAWSPNGQWLAAAVRDDGLYLWNTSSWELTPSLRHETVLGLAFSADSRRLASSGYNRQSRIIVHEVAPPKVVAEVGSQNNYWSLSFSPVGELLVCGRGDGYVDLFESRTADGELVRRTLRVGDDTVRAVVFAEGGQSLVTALEDDRVLRIWSMAELVGARSYRYAPACLDVAVATQRAILRDPNGQHRLATFPPAKSPGERLDYKRPISTARFFPRGDLLATSGPDPRVLVHDVASRQLRYVLKTPGDPVEAIAVSPDGCLVTGSGKSGTVWIWNVASQSLVHTLEGHAKGTVRCAFSSDRTRLATVSSNEQRVLIWDCATGQRLAAIPVDEDTMHVVFSPDGRLLAVAGYEGGLFVCDATAARVLATLHGHQEAIRAVDFSPDGRLLASAGDDGTVRLWHVAMQQELCTVARRSRPVHWLRFLSATQLVAGTEPYLPGPASDLLMLEADPSAAARL